MFCPKCGTQLQGNPKFCNECGAKITSQNIGSPATMVNNWIQCPGCGSNLSSFETKCPSCGREIRNTDSISSVKRLENMLIQIEEKRQPTPKAGFLSDAIPINPTDKQKAGCIEAFVIPTTREDIVEFMILASSNIDAKAIGTDGSNVERGSYLVIKSWYSKFEQAYQKAKIALVDDPLLPRVEEIYNKKVQEIQTEKKTKSMGSIRFLLIVFGAFLAYILLMKFADLIF